MTALTGSLRAVVYTAAQNGFLRALVVDEAHIVGQWGDAFRPAFQEISGFRTALLRESALPVFRTVLLSATLTAACLDTLETLFGSPGPFGLVSAVQLRPEPSYWIAWCASQEIQENRVLEAIRHLPRPLILYATEVKRAKEWHSLLKRQQGYGRIGLMTGETSNTEREQIIQQWANGDLDIVAATSAFGLGIDQQDVRTVIHACVPETLDRLYQEVGRGGRDGNASISLVIYTARDLEVAQRMTQPRLITAELGLPRWTQMFRAKQSEPIRDGTWRVPINIAPGFDTRHIDMVNDRNTEWNLNTLTLMCRAGLIALDDAPYERESGGDPETLTRVVRILDNAHLSPERWQERVELLRESSAVALYNLFALLKELLSGKRCVAEILAEAYQVPARRGERPRESVRVALSCGGCPACRRKGRHPFALFAPRPRYPWPPQTEVGDRLRTLLIGHNLLAIFYSASERETEKVREWRKVATWALAQGVRSIVAPAPTLEEFIRIYPRFRDAPVFFSHRYEARHIPRIPTLVLCAENEVLQDADGWIQNSREQEHLWSPHILLLSDDLRDPTRPDRMMRDILACPTLTLNELKARENL